MSKTILLTGASGFVGSQVRRVLREKGLQVRLLSRHAETVTNNEELWLSHDLFSETQAQYQKMCSGINTVIHLAWYAEPGQYLNSEKNEPCRSGSIKLAEGALAAGCHHFIGIGTCLEYDLGQQPLTPNTPLKPNTVYGRAKANTFLTLQQLFANSDTRFSWCRLFYLYGDNEDPRRLSSYVRQQLANNQVAMLGNGELKRDFLSTDSAAQQIVALALHPPAANGSHNICSGQAVSIRDWVTRLAQPEQYHLLQFNSRSHGSADEIPLIVGVPSPQVIAAQALEK